MTTRTCSSSACGSSCRTRRRPPRWASRSARFVHASPALGAGYASSWGNQHAEAEMNRTKRRTLVAGRWGRMDDIVELEELWALAPAPPVRSLSPERLALRKEILMREVMRSLDSDASAPP